MAEKAIRIGILQSTVTPGADINGTVTVSYRGRFDGVQVNTYVIGANEQARFVNIDGKTVSILARLYVSRNEMLQRSSFNFSVRIEKKDLPRQTKIRFRAAIIQEHKEIESDVILVPISSG